MNIEIVNKDIFSIGADVLVNPVNIVGAMGKGLALQFRERYPEMYQEYKEKCKKGELYIGELHIYRYPDIEIINFPTKKHWRDPSRIEYIEEGLLAYLKEEKNLRGKITAFPMLGTGLGGLDPQEVLTMMMDYLSKSSKKIYICVKGGTKK